ncbi:MAG: NAD-dependent epimerase/dehydratase family protein [Candidatus Bathyarchaeia archaeon]
MSVLVTGGTGLIGAHLSEILVEKGYRPILFDLYPNTRIISHILDKVKIVRGDVTSLSSLVEAAKRYEVTDIFHLAAIISVAAEANPLAALNINVIGTVNALETARIFDVKKFVFPSTSVVYGPEVQHPVEGSPEDPPLMYGITKVTCEQWCRYYQRRYGLEVRGTRFISIIGPGRKNGGASRVTSLMIEKAALHQPYEIYVDENTKIPILYLKDATDVLMRIFEAPKVTTSFYNIGGIEPTVGEIYRKVKSIIPDAPLTWKPDPQMIKTLKGWPNLDSTRVRTDLGWSHAYDLDSMVEDFIRTVQANKELYL